MDDSNKEEFAKEFYAMGKYYNKEIDTGLLLMLFSDLIEFSISDIKAGARKHRLDPKHGRFFPKAADIIDHLQTGKLSTEDKAQLAWAQINHELRKHGAWGNLELDDKQAIAALKSFTTWKEFCMAPVSDMTWMQKKFMSMYSTYENTPLDMLPSSLPGLEDLHNHKEKYAELGAQSAGDIMKTLADKMNLNK